MTLAEEFAYRLTAFRNATETGIRKAVGEWLIANLERADKENALPPGHTMDSLADELSEWLMRAWDAANELPSEGEAPEDPPVALDTFDSPVDEENPPDAEPTDEGPLDTDPVIEEEAAQDEAERASE